MNSFLCRLSNSQDSCFCTSSSLFSVSQKPMRIFRMKKGLSDHHRHRVAVVNIEWWILIPLFILIFFFSSLGNSSYLVRKASWMGRCSGGLWQEDGHKQRRSWADARTDALLGSTWWMVREECLKSEENVAFKNGAFLFSGCCHPGAIFLPEFLSTPAYLIVWVSPPTSHFICRSPNWS